MMYINSAGNPLIYSLTSTKFKKAFKNTIRLRRRAQTTDVTSNKQLNLRTHKHMQGIIFFS
jgi:hypothetical protein